MNQNDISKRHEMSINDISKKSIETIGIFQNPTEKAFYACAQKIEKIVAAIYLVTDIMDSQVSLTRSLCDCGLEMMSKCYRLLDESMNPRNVVSVIITIEEVTSLVGIGRIAHQISEMNANIIESELSKVGVILMGEHTILNEKYLSYEKNERVSQPMISRAVTDDGLFDQVSRERELIHNVGRSGMSNHFKTTPQIKTTFKTTSINDIQENVVYQNDIQQDKTTFKTTPKNITTVDLQSQILDKIKVGKNTTGADVKTFFPKVNDKTLQRNLAKLIEVGLIKREGNKRWAIYNVVKN